MKTELKPCQCGCDTVEIIHIPGKRQMILTCPKCRITINHKYIRMNPDELRQAIVKAWNTRPTEDALQARITELEAENKYLGNMPVNTVKAPDAIIYDNAIGANRELTTAVKHQQQRITELVED